MGSQTYLYVGLWIFFCFLAAYILSFMDNIYIFKDLCFTGNFETLFQSCEPWLKFLAPMA